MAKKHHSVKADKDNTLSNLFPSNGKVLLTGGGKQFVERIGVEAIRQAVYSVMKGENVRAQTEPISRRRIAQVSGAIIAMITQGYLTVDGFQNKLSQLAVEELQNAHRNDNAIVWPAQWLIGLTGKSVQNVLRSDPAAFAEYVKDFEVAIREAAKQCKNQIGDYKMSLGYISNGKESKVELDWEGITRLTTAIGAQTLTIRGSDKSMYGKLFERLILGSILTLLGFKRVDRTTNKQTHGIFWLSDSTDNRESDATLILSPGIVARFDIGFIGPGNSEISKDKLSRFARDIEINGGQNSSVTFIVVDRLPTTGKTKEAAGKIGAEIIQMSMQYWPKELAIKIKERFGFRHAIQKVHNNNLNDYLKDALAGIPMQDFLSDVTIE